MSELKECSSDFPTTPSDKYRYFNQPVEQIPGYDKEKAQILFHQKGALVWQDIAECVEVVKCVKLETEGEANSLVMEQQRIRPLQDLGAIPADGGGSASACAKIPTEAIDVITCISLDSATNELKITRKKVYVLKQGDASPDCENIPTIVCTTSSP